MKIDGKTNELIIKVVNYINIKKLASFQIEGVEKIQSKGILAGLSNSGLDTVHPFESPEAIRPVISSVAVKNKRINFSLNRYSVNMVKIKL